MPQSTLAVLVERPGGRVEIEWRGRVGNERSGVSYGSHAAARLAALAAGAGGVVPESSLHESKETLEEKNGTEAEERTGEVAP